ncbi:MAG: hypothetical protein OEY10_00135 [Nitrosopumilus sp.]|nr:hypothetical protein [Nitrosopumilus sp.]
MEKNEITREELVHIIAYGFEVEGVDLEKTSKEEIKRLAKEYANEAARELCGSYDESDITWVIDRITE